MPELPEVEHAARIARRAAQGQVIATVRVLHSAQRRTLPVGRARLVRGERVTAVTRRGKYQLFSLAGGRTLVVHFRMTGDWATLAAGASAPAHTRVRVDFDGGTSLALVDPRALSTVTLVEEGEDPLPKLGPEATDREFTASGLRRLAGHRATAIKMLLLDQSVVAGVGNIYASEALWQARVNPHRGVRSLSDEEWRRVVSGVKRVMRAALAQPARYYQQGAEHVRFNVYGREGRPCRRCRTAVRRVTQGARSSYYCPSCQR